uniref:Uncharacterized protein n=1 Tax=Anguilla anguilla TaxID=7936 RepID=A0A0E9XQC2_ANGAN
MNVKLQLRLTLQLAAVHVDYSTALYLLTNSFPQAFS